MTPEEFWQGFTDTAPPAPWTDAYPAAMPDGRFLLLPIRPLAGTDNAIASLILNQTAFDVEAALAETLADRIAVHEPEVVVGLPTLGLSLARAVAQRLGHRRYVAASTSKKFWYDPALSVSLSSITSPGAEKKLYLDPRMVGLLQGRRVALVDDVISSGRSILAGLDLLAAIDVRPVAVGAAMLQTERWRTALGTMAVEGVFHSPLLARKGGGWVLANGA